MASFDKGGHGKIWQDVTRGTWQDLARYDKGGQDLVRIDKGDMSRFGKIWKDLTRGAMARFLRFDKGDMSSFGRI